MLICKLSILPQTPRRSSSCGIYRQGCLSGVKSSCSWLPAGHGMLDRGLSLHAKLGTGQRCQPLRILIYVRLHQLIHLHAPVSSQQSAGQKLCMACLHIV